MSSIVLDLQQELISSDCDIIAALRKAHLIASKLQLHEFDVWVQSELNGYKCSLDELPEYRQVQGFLQASDPLRGWLPVIITNNSTDKKVSIWKFRESITDVLALGNISQEYIMMVLPIEVALQLDHCCSSPIHRIYRVQISKHLVNAIKGKVVNTLMEWTIKLEAEGILGENVVFSDSEKEAAKSVEPVINNHFYDCANVINAPVKLSSIVAGDNTSVSFTYEAARDATEEIAKSINKESMSQDDRETVMELLSEIKGKISQEKKPSIIKSALIVLKDFLFEIGARVSVNLIEAKLQGLF